MAGDKAPEVQVQDSFEAFKFETKAALLKAKMDTDKLQILI